MRLPRITIEYQEEESYALGKVSPSLIAGFGVHWAWVYLFMFNGGQLFYPGSANLQDVLFLSSIALFSVTLLGYGVFLPVARELFSTGKKRSRNRLAATIMVFVGMLVSVLGSVAPYAALPFAVLSGALCGVGSAVLLMSFAVSFSVCDLPTVAVCVAASIPLGAVGFSLIGLGEWLLPGLGGAACLALPFVEYACLGACSKQLVDNLEFGALTIPVHTRPFAVHICLPCAVFGFALGVISVRAISVSMQEGVSDVMLAIVASGAVAGIMLVFALLTQRKSNNFAFRTLLPAVAVLLSALTFVPDANEGASASFVLFGAYTMLSACIWILCSDISQRFRISAFTAFGFGWGMMSVGTMVGVAVSIPMGPLSSLATDAGQLLALAFVTIVLGSSLLPNNSELRHTLKRGAYCPALVGENDYAVDVLREQNIAIAADPRVEVEPAMEPVPDSLGQVAAWALEDGEAPDADESAEKARCVEEKARCVEGEQCVESAQNSEGMQAEAVEKGDVAKWDATLGAGTRDAVASARAAEKKHAEGEADASAESDEAKKHTMGRFKRKCSVVADRYLLSRKETEVMFLLAKGYKSAQIQETLFISEGTANTHMRHIYRKLDVHSQRELMDLVDAEKVPEQDF